MKPLPDINDEAAMLLRGRRSALAAARSESVIALRDAYTALDGCNWDELAARINAMRSVLDRLALVSVTWGTVNGATEEGS